MAYDEESQSVHKRYVSYPWTKGKNLDAEWFGDPAANMFEASDNEGRFFAVKEFPIPPPSEKRDVELSKLVEEIRTLSSLAHKNVVQYMGCEIAIKTRKLRVFLELVSKKSLLSVYQDYKLSEKQISGYTRDILNGLQYLHNRQISHRNIRCATVGVDGDATCRLANFGCALQLISSLDGRDHNSGTETLPLQWLAPERFHTGNENTLSADIWSLGCTVIEMARRSPPHGDVAEKQLHYMIVQGRERPPIPQILSEEAKDFINQCLQDDPAERPTATQLLQHRFIVSPPQEELSSESEIFLSWSPQTELVDTSESQVLDPGTQSNNKQGVGCTIVEMTQDTSPYDQSEEKKRARSVKKDTFLNKMVKIARGEAQSVPEMISESSEDSIKLPKAFNRHERPTTTQLSPQDVEQRQLKNPKVQVTLEEVLLEISKELEGDDACEMYCLNAEWMGQLAREDGHKIQVIFQDSGYYQTVTTSTYICYEYISEFCGEPATDSDNPMPQTGADDGSSQKSPNEALNQSELVPATFDQSASHLEEGDGGKMKISESDAVAQREALNSNECAVDCQYIPLKVHFKRDGSQAESSSSSMGQDTKPEKKEYARFFAQDPLTEDPPPPGCFPWMSRQSERQEFEAQIMLSCCLEKGQLCIKIPHMASQINKAETSAAMIEMRLSVAATVDNQAIVLIAPNLDHDDGRVIQSARAIEDTDQIQHHGHDVSGEFDLSLNVQGSVGCGRIFTMTPRPATSRVIARRGEKLKVVVLKRGDRACPNMVLSQVLVLERSIRNTYLTKSDTDRTAVAIRGDSEQTVKLTGDISKVTRRPSDKSVLLKITCCVELEITSISAFAGTRAEKSQIEEVVTRAKRGIRRIEFSNFGHAVFEGNIHFESFISS